MRRVFADAGAWIALCRPDERLHGLAARKLEDLDRARTRIVTSNYVIDEAATRLRYDRGLPVAVSLRERVNAARDSGFLKVAWVDPRIENEAWGLLEANPEVRLSLTDATSAVIARRADITQIFGFDADFRALGFELVPAT